MNSFKRLKKMLFQKKITEEEYNEAKEARIEAICRLYANGHIEKEELEKFLKE